MVNKKQKSQNISSYALKIPAQTKRKRMDKKVIRQRPQVHTQVHQQMRPPKDLFQKSKASHEVAIDISDFSVEVLQLTKEKRVNAYGRCVLKKNIVKDGIILDQERLVEALKDVLRNTKPNNLDITNNKLSAILSLPESRTFIHSFTVSKEIKGDKLIKAIEGETARAVPFKQNRLRSDFVTRTDDDTRRVLYAGVLEEEARMYNEVLSKAGVEPILLDIEAASLGRALLEEQDLKAVAMIVDIGARTTNISVFNVGGALWMSALVPRGGMHITENVAEKLNISIDEAENLKRQYGFNSTQGKYDIADTISGQYEKIIREIQKTCQYYEHKQSNKIGIVILAGGSSFTPGIVKYFEQKLGCKVRVGNPTGNIKNASVIGSNRTILYANVIGLALRASDDISKGLNLLERSNYSLPSQNGKIQLFQKQSKIFLKILKKRSVFVIIIVFLLLLVMFMYID